MVAVEERKSAFAKGVWPWCVNHVLREGHPSKQVAQIVLDRFLEKKGNRTPSCVGKEGGMDPGEEMTIAKAHFMKYSENYEKQTSKKKVVISPMGLNPEPSRSLLIPE